MPSLRELAPLWGFHSKTAADKLCQQLLRLGVIGKDAKTGELLPTKVITGLPCLGVVGASFPSPAEEELGDVMDLDEYLIRNKEATFILEVSGDSMIDAGLLPGDLVLVQRGLSPASTMALRSNTSVNGGARSISNPPTKSISRFIPPRS
jgi:repressor LexA